MRRLLLAAVAAICIGKSTISHAAPVMLYSSIEDLTAQPIDNNLASSASRGVQTYDTFSLSSASSVTRIDFVVSGNHYCFQPITVAIVPLSGTLPDTSATPFYKNTFSYPTTLSFSGYTYTATQVNHPEPPKSNTVSVLVSGLALAAGAYDITFYGTGLILDDFSSDAQARQNGYFVYQSGRTNDGDGFVRYKSLGFDLIGTSVAAPSQARCCCSAGASPVWPLSFDSAFRPINRGYSTSPHDRPASQADRCGDNDPWYRHRIMPRAISDRHTP